MTAYTAISAYAGRTDANKGWAIRAVCEGAAEILKTADESTATSSAAMTGHEKLARAQALWLLQTVRCFDGDVSLRAQAVRDMGVLKRWLKDLEGLRDNLDELSLLDDLVLRQRPPRSWEVWVFNECVRRTVFLGHLFTSLFEILMAAGKFILSFGSQWKTSIHIASNLFFSLPFFFKKNLKADRSRPSRV